VTASIPDLMREARADDSHWNRVLSTMAADLERIEDEAYSPLRAQSFEPSEGRGLHLWCIEHDQLLNHCENDANDGCVVGDEEAMGGMHSDPTGAAGIIKSTPARAKLNRAKRLLEARRRNTDELESLLRDAARSDTAADRKETAAANEKQEACCDPCSRAGAWSPPATAEPTTVAGRLDKALMLCDWHRKFVTAHGELPTHNEEVRHQAGQKVTRVVRQTDRLVRAFETGKLGA
jgi:hypothetical protein